MKLEQIYLGIHPDLIDHEVDQPVMEKPTFVIAYEAYDYHRRHNDPYMYTEGISGSTPNPSHLELNAYYSQKSALWSNFIDQVSLSYVDQQPEVVRHQLGDKYPYWLLSCESIMNAYLQLDTDKYQKIKHMLQNHLDVTEEFADLKRRLGVIHSPENPYSSEYFFPHQALAFASQPIK